MFAGLDDIDWAEMHHAYGEATEVPAWIRGLVSDDPATREESLDSMYGAAHHQGDVYECTLAAVPFLIEALTTAGRPGRGGVAQLLASIGGAGWTGEGLDERLGREHDGDPDPDSVGAMGQRMLEARRQIRAVGAAIAGLATDPDPDLRRAIPELLTLCAAEDAARVLMGRLDEETDPEARLALVAQVGRIGCKAHGELANEIVTWLAGLVDRAPQPSISATALIQLASVRPGELPADLAGVAVRLTEAAYAEPAPAAAAADFETETLVGALRRESEKQSAGRRAPHVVGLIRDIGEAFGSQVADCGRYVNTLLESPEWDILVDAVTAARNLVNKWRGDHSQTVELLSRLVSHPEPRVAEWASGSLEYWGSLAAPAADALAAELARLDALPGSDGRPAWVHRWGDGKLGVVPVMTAFVRLGDERAYPLLLRALRLRAGLDSLIYACSGFAPRHADEIVVAVRPLLAARGDRRSVAYGPLAVLGACGPAAAPAVAEILAQPADQLVPRTLGRIGPAARAAVPALRRMLASEDAAIVSAAAVALWKIDADASAVSRLVAGIDGPARWAALDGLAELGTAAADAAPYVATVLDTEDPTWWTPLRAARALWRMRGDAEAVLPVLRAAWLGNERTRSDVLDCVVEMGPTAAEFVPLIQTELSEVRRAGLTDGGWSSAQVTDDEELQAKCRAALAAITGCR